MFTRYGVICVRVAHSGSLASGVRVRGFRRLDDWWRVAYHSTDPSLIEHTACRSDTVGVHEVCQPWSRLEHSTGIEASGH